MQDFVHQQNEAHRTRALTVGRFRCSSRHTCSGRIHVPQYLPSVVEMANSIVSVERTMCCVAPCAQGAISLTQPEMGVGAPGSPMTPPPPTFSVVRMVHARRSNRTVCQCNTVCAWSHHCLRTIPNPKPKALSPKPTTQNLKPKNPRPLHPEHYSDFRV